MIDSNKGILAAKGILTALLLVAATIPAEAQNDFKDLLSGEEILDEFEVVEAEDDVFGSRTREWKLNWSLRNWRSRSKSCESLRKSLVSWWEGDGKGKTAKIYPETKAFIKKRIKVCDRLRQEQPRE